MSVPLAHGPQRERGRCIYITPPRVPAINIPHMLTQLSPIAKLVHKSQLNKPTVLFIFGDSVHDPPVIINLVQCILSSAPTCISLPSISHLPTSSPTSSTPSSRACRSACALSAATMRGPSNERVP